MFPDRYEPHFNIGSVLEALGRYEQAIRSYRRALELAPDQLQTIENLNRCYMRANTHPGESKILMDKALERETRPDWRLWLEEQMLRLPEKGRGVEVFE